MTTPLQRLLDGRPPSWLRKIEVRVISAVFAKALDAQAPSMRTRNAGEALIALQEFSTARMEASLAGGLAQTHRARLGQRARTLGTWIRRLAPMSQATRAHLVRYLYRGINIELVGFMPGELRFGPCSFARYYSPACCALMSAFDEGFICGIMGLSGPLVFETRLTEGATCCFAFIGQ